MKDSDNIKKINPEQNLVLKSREKLTVSGVEDVDSFDDKIISVYTNKGLLKIRGENLNIIKISVESGELNVEGKISGLIFIDDEKKKTGFLNKIFK